MKVMMVSEYFPIGVLTESGFFKLYEGLNDVLFSSIIELEDKEFNIVNNRLEKIIDTKVVENEGRYPPYIVVMKKIVIMEDDSGKTLVRIIDDKIPLDVIIHSLMITYEGMISQITQVMDKHMELINELAKAKSLTMSVGKKGLIPVNTHIAIIGVVEDIAVPLPTGDYAVVNREDALELYNYLMEAFCSTYSRLGGVRELLMVKLEALSKKMPLDIDVKDELKILEDISNELGGPPLSYPSESED